MNVKAISTDVLLGIVPIALLVVMLWGIVAWRHRQYFSGIFVQQTS